MNYVQKKKGHKGQNNVNAMNLLQNMQYSWNILCFADAHSKVTRRNLKLNKCTMYIWYPVATGLRKYDVNIDLRHHYGISVVETQTSLLVKHP